MWHGWGCERLKWIRKSGMVRRCRIHNRADTGKAPTRSLSVTKLCIFMVCEVNRARAFRNAHHPGCEYFDCCSVILEVSNAVAPPFHLFYNYVMSTTRRQPMRYIYTASAALWHQAC